MQVELAPPTPTTSRRTGVLMLLACAAMWSLNGLLVKHARADPIAFAALRSAIAAVVVLPVMFFLRGAWPAPLTMAWSVLFHTLMVAFFIAAITLGTAASGVILQYTGPAWVALIAWGIQGKRLTRRTVAAIVLTCAGVFVMLAVPMAQSEHFDPVGPACGLAAGIAFAALIVMLDKIDRDAGGPNPLAIIFFNNFGTALLLIPLCLLLDRLHLTPRQFGVIAFCGVLQHALPYVLFQFALRRVTSVEASLLILLEPILSPTWVAIFIGELPSVSDVLGGAAILVALLLEATKKSLPEVAHLPAE